jgi:sugar/nucleoside kinase (ribokinase family)
VVAVTHGAEGASIHHRAGTPADPHAWPASRGHAPGPAAGRRHPCRPAAGDPTGCGDVWGATFFASLLGGHGWEGAAARAHEAAARKMGVRGTRRLYEHLR